MDILPAQLREWAEETGTLACDARVETRAQRLRAELKKRGSKMEVAIVGDHLEVELPPSSDIWVRLKPIERNPNSDDKEGKVNFAEIRRNFEDNTIQAMADLLEAKYRTDKFRETHLRGTADDPSLF